MDKIDKLYQVEHTQKKQMSENKIDLEGEPLNYTDSITSLNQSQCKNVVIRVSHLGYNTQYIEYIIKIQHRQFGDIPQEFIIAQVYDECCDKKNQEIFYLLMNENEKEDDVEEETSYLEKLLLQISLNWLGPQQEDQIINKNVQWVDQNTQGDQQEVATNIVTQMNNQQKLNKIQTNKGPKLLVHKNEKVLNSINKINDQPLVVDHQEFKDSIQKECCLICLNDIYQSEMLAVAPCGHRFCKECNLSYMGDCIRNANVMRVNCPMESCKEEYTEEIIQQNVSIEMWLKFKNFKQKKIISMIPNVRWCPKINCELYVISGCLFAKTLKCQCGQEICFDCGNAAHPNLSCENALDDFYKIAKKLYKIHPCPKCKAPIQKNSGCNHMTCYQCNNEYCWICMGSYSKYHFSIFNIFGCIVPRGLFHQTKPWTNPILWKILLFIPKLIGVILLLISLAIILLIPSIITIISEPYQRYRISYPILHGQPYSKLILILEMILFFLVGIILIPITLIQKIMPQSCENETLQHWGNNYL